MSKSNTKKYNLFVVIIVDLLNIATMTCLFKLTTIAHITVVYVAEVYCKRVAGV